MLTTMRAKVSSCSSVAFKSWLLTNSNMASKSGSGTRMGTLCPLMFALNFTGPALCSISTNWSAASRMPCRSRLVRDPTAESAGIEPDAVPGVAADVVAVGFCG